MYILTIEKCFVMDYIIYISTILRTYSIKFYKDITIS